MAISFGSYCIAFQCPWIKDYRKSSIKPPGGLYNFGHSRWGPTTEWGLFKKLDEKDIYDRFISLLPHILRIQDAIFMSQIHKFDRFLSQTISKLTCNDL